MIRNKQEHDAAERLESHYTVWATHSCEFKHFLREAPEQFEVLYALWATCSDALRYRAEEAYQAIGHPRPHGPCLFEVQLYLLANIVDLMDSFDQHEETIRRFVQFACHCVAVDLHPRLVTNADLHKIAQCRLSEYWELRSSSSNWGELYVDRVKRLQLHLDASGMTPTTIREQHPLCLCGDIFDNRKVFSTLVAYSTHIGTAMGYSLKKVLQASRDVTSLGADDIQRLIDQGAREAGAMRDKEAPKSKIL